MRLIFFSIASIIIACSYSQEAAIENNIAINYKVASWKFNTSLGHRAINERIGETSETRLAFLEINQFVTRKINSRLSISAGYKYRDINNSIDEIEHRLTQQAAYTHQKEHIRLVSRVRLEQRFRDEFAHRYRYRFSADMPLSGIKLDAKEFYLIASNELILQERSRSRNIDNRLSLGSGYVFSKSLKLQIEITHRMENLNSTVEHIPFLTSSLIFNAN